MHELLDNVDLEIGHVVFHHFADCDLVSDVVKHVRELAIPDPVVLLKSDQEVLLFGGKELGLSNDILEVLERDNAVFNNVNLLEEILKELVALLNFVPVDKLESIWVWVFHFFGLLLGDVSSIEGLDCADTDWNKLIPVN